MSDKYEIYEYKGAFASDKRVLKNGKAVNEFELLKDVQRLQAENAELKVLNATQENLLKACIKWMDSKGCPVPYDLRVALETPPEGE